MFRSPKSQAILGLPLAKEVCICAPLFDSIPLSAENDEARLPVTLQLVDEEWQPAYASGALVDMTSNQNAPSTKAVDSDSLMGILTKAASNQNAQSTKAVDSHWRNLVSSLSALSHDTKS